MVVGINVSWAAYPDVLKEAAISTEDVITSCFEESALPKLVPSTEVTVLFALPKVFEHVFETVCGH
jgi:hypothetical protein